MKIESAKLLVINNVKRYLVLTFGLFLASVAFNFFLLPHNIIATGSFGLLLIASHIWGINEPTFLLVMNIILITLSFFFIGKTFAIKGIAGAIIILPFFTAVLPVRMVVNSTVISVIIAGLLNGICVACLFYSDGSAGGTTIFGKFISKYAKVKFSTGIAISDGTIVLAGIFVFGIVHALFGLMAIAITRTTAHIIENKIMMMRNTDKFTDI